MNITIKGKEFKVTPIGIADRIALKAKGFDFLKIMFEMSENKTNKQDFPSDLIDEVFVLKFKDKFEDLDAIGIDGQVEIFTKIIELTCSGNTEKN